VSVIVALHAVSHFLGVHNSAGHAKTQ
jgi:hypothetical protein